ncbi:hypothetical protein FIBSPDRAFT_895204 [Athelia psychrophila]|uniref:Uncharacterized protein n=1 Tax=Athelia psychrophila TaxID=1759441 RepID=A0A166EVK4_9AGAM|nr:hypothetical protein FIBSPDRAFT_895204 [Fibularhizoctonia sp. CBS 109695]
MSGHNERGPDTNIITSPMNLLHKVDDTILDAAVFNAAEVVHPTVANRDRHETDNEDAPSAAAPNMGPNNGVEEEKSTSVALDNRNVLQTATIPENPDIPPIVTIQDEHGTSDQDTPPIVEHGSLSNDATEDVKPVIQSPGTSNDTINEAGSAPARRRPRPTTEYCTMKHQGKVRRRVRKEGLEQEHRCRSRKEEARYEDEDSPSASRGPRFQGTLY